MLQSDRRVKIVFLDWHSTVEALEGELQLVEMMRGVTIGIPSLPACSFNEMDPPNL